MCIAITIILCHLRKSFPYTDYGFDAYDDIYGVYVNMYYESNIPIYWFIRPTMLRAGEEPGKVMDIS